MNHNDRQVAIWRQHTAWYATWVSWWSGHWMQAARQHQARTALLFGKPKA
jgi:hypothetical protein